MIDVRLTPTERSRLTTAKAVNPEAHAAYLRGRFFFNRPSGAMELDPAFFFPVRRTHVVVFSVRSRTAERRVHRQRYGITLNCSDVSTTTVGTLADGEPESVEISSDMPTADVTPASAKP